MIAKIFHDKLGLRLPMLDEASMDSIVTDPPYELGFMGKSWDSSGVAFRPETWVHVLRVLKPGGHLVAFGGTRTYHRLACAIEDAGFEIRDQIGWVFGSGFPKSHNLHDEWEGWGTALKPAWEPICLARKPFKGSVAKCVAENRTGALNIAGCRIEGEAVPINRLEEWSGFGQKERPEYVQELNTLGRWPANLIHDGSDEVMAAFPIAPGQMADVKFDAEELKTQNIYGAMKRGHEPSADSENVGDVGFRMKPGARRLDEGSAARFFYCAKASKVDRNEGLDGAVHVIIEGWGNEDQKAHLLVDTALFPPKVISACGMLNSDVTEWNTMLFGSGTTNLFRQASMSTTKTKSKLTTTSEISNCFLSFITNASTQDANSEMENGGSHVENVDLGHLLMTTTSERMASALGVGPAVKEMQLKVSAAAARSKHPTVKPTDLMRYLCRLITPPGGTVLDCFMGSGSTGKAALLEGFNFIGIEREAEYCAIAKARMEHVIHTDSPLLNNGVVTLE